MEEKKLVPKLRFPGFTEPWEQRKFGDLFEYERPDAYIVKSDNYNNDFNMPVLTANKAFILGYTNEENSYNKPSIIFDDFTLDRKYVDFPYMLKSSAIKILTSKNQHNLRFLFERLNSTRFEVLGHARHYISVVQNTTTLCPSVDEEVCISNLLTKFDELITLHQRKLEHLKLKKKSLLQKLFPKEGEVYPELRFPGFTDPWEQRKLSEVVTINPKTELPDEFKYVDLESVVGTNLLGFQVIKKENAPSRAQRLASYGDVFYQTVRPYQRNNYLFENVDKDMVFSTGYAQLRSKLDSYFLLTLVQNDNFVKVVLDNCTGTSYPAINGSELGKITVQIPPNEAEADQIGKVFRGIDKSITLHQRKLEHLQLLKKALLQQLFV